MTVGALLAACSQPGGGDGEPSTAPPPRESTAAPTATSASTSTPAPAPSSRPSAGAPIADVIAWVQAGRPTDPASHHEAYRELQTTQLGDDVAFTADSGAANGSTQCITDATYNSGALTCLVTLTAPAPPPPGAEGLWKAGWVDYSGAGARIGALRGDPGPFINGAGARLRNGDTLAFGDYRCRSDATGLGCVNYAHRSGVWIDADGIIPFGCLAPMPPPDGAGQAFRC